METKISEMLFTTVILMASASLVTSQDRSSSTSMGTTLDSVLSKLELEKSVLETLQIKVKGLDTKLSHLSEDMLNVKADDNLNNLYRQDSVIQTLKSQVNRFYKNLDSLDHQGASIQSLRSQVRNLETDDLNQYTELQYLQAKVDNVSKNLTEVDHQGTSIQALQCQVNGQSTDLLHVKAKVNGVSKNETDLDLQEGVIQALKSQVNRLEFTLVQQSNHSLMLLTNLQAEVNNVSKNFTERLDTFNADYRVRGVSSQVAFTAFMSATTVEMKTDQPFIFEAVTTNIGNAYNKNTGTFVAPCDGVYMFYFIMRKTKGVGSVQAQIMKETQELGVTSADGKVCDDGSALATTHLNKGQKVFVKSRHHNVRVYGNFSTSFSGFMIWADS